MCGIWGYVGSDSLIRVDDAWDGLCALTDRGPDAWGAYIEDQGHVVDETTFQGYTGVFLGNRRLQILDLTAAGNQPMVADDRYWIVYNGEVYNYRELRERLRRVGYRFTSDSDTEVVLRAYQEWGAGCVERFRGMFAFAVWDEREETLFACRDRFGIKPFYYDATGGDLAFSSEVTALLEAGATQPRLDPVGVDGFLTFGSVPAPRTILSGVRSLPPASTLKYVRGDEEPTVQRYWTPTFGDADETTLDRLRGLLEDSVSLRLRSDVPVGAFLSGGLDSSAVVALMRAVRDSEEPLHTFSIGFEETEYSETDFAEVVAEVFGTRHTSRTVRAIDVREELPEVVAEMDQPTIDGLNTYFVSKLAGESGLTVALSGLGGDELFYGYPTFAQVPRLARLARLHERLPEWVGIGLVGLFDRLDRVADLPFAQLADACRAAAPFGAAYVASRGVFTARQRERLLGREVTDWSRNVQETVERTLARSSARDGVSHVELAWYMHNQLLRDTDVMSMAHSLEVRVPLLDAALADAVMGVPTAMKARGEKALLADTVVDDLPAAVLEREKSGFTFPMAEWLRGELAPVVDDALAREGVENTPLDPEAVQSVRERFEDGNLHWSRLWALVVLSLWVDEHLSRD